MTGLATTRLAIKRLLSVAVLMLLSPSAYAGSSFSFVVGGHRIHVEAPSHCDSPSCVSVSIPGIYQIQGSGNGYRDRYYDDAPEITASTNPPAPTPLALPVAARPAAPPACQPLPGSVAAAPPVVPAVAAQSAAPLPARIQPAPSAPVAPPIKTSQVETSIDAPRPVAEAAPAIAAVSHETEDDLDTPLGDWQTEGNKGSVRIERCGRALCGYVLDPSSNAKGEAVLIGMKPKDALKDILKDASKNPWQWSGHIYSRDSGNTYYATMVLKGPNSLQVEACVLGKFFCSGNVWSRIDLQPAKLITYRQIFSQPKS
jgi:uncharacterized protein (DUF2147 family)